MNAMYNLSVPIFKRFLENLILIIDKAQAHCDVKKIDPNALLQARLYPDMFHLTKQIQLSCDFAKGGTARLAAIEVPKFEDIEVTFADLKARAQKTLDFMASVSADKFEGSDARMITVPLKEPVTLPGLNYLQVMALPNFFFHLTTVYAILRHNGVEVGKMDFIGAPRG